MSLSASYAWCERLTRQAAANFYPAMQVLPRRQRRAMYALYAFNRLTDDQADGDALNKSSLLNQWRIDLERMLAGTCVHPIAPALRHAVARFRIPLRHLHDVIDGCEMDVEPRRYRDFGELYRYCTLVASSVGQACIHIWGHRGDAEPLAEAAGVALQLTNILRDLGEDRERGRIYLPADELARFGCPPHLCDSPTEPSFQRLMAFQLGRAREYYSTARRLHTHLTPSGRAIYRVMLTTYERLLDRIEECRCDVFTQRVSVGKWEKLGLVARAIPVRMGWLRE